MASEVAQALARLSQRSDFTGPEDLVFPSMVGEHLDPSALRRRFRAAVARAGLRELRFHDLRHTFGSLAIDRASIVQVQAWMGHAAVSTTMRYPITRARRMRPTCSAKRSAPLLLRRRWSKAHGWRLHDRAGCLGG